MKCAFPWQQHQTDWTSTQNCEPSPVTHITYGVMEYQQKPSLLRCVNKFNSICVCKAISRKLKNLRDWTYIWTVRYAALFKGPEKNRKKIHKYLWMLLTIQRYPDPVWYSFWKLYTKITFLLLVARLNKIFWRSVNGLELRSSYIYERTTIYQLMVAEWLRSWSEKIRGSWFKSVISVRQTVELTYCNPLHTFFFRWGIPVIFSVIIEIYNSIVKTQVYYIKYNQKNTAAKYLGSHEAIFRL
jgi:hypothetical protein